MKAQRSQTLKALFTTALVAAAGTLLAADMVKYQAQPNSKVKIEGTSSIHDWAVNGMIIGGTMELGFDPKAATPGKAPANVIVTIPVRTLKSGQKGMDDIMYAAMKMPGVKTIEYRLSELTVKEAGNPVKLESKGRLMVAGVTNEITMPVTMTPMDGGKLKTAGTIPLKMTDFKIEPPAPKIAGGAISTGDEVKVSFEWITAPAK